MNRKEFLKLSASGAAGVATLPIWVQGCAPSELPSTGLFFDISLAQWSLHKTFFEFALVKAVIKVFTMIEFIHN